MFLFLSFLMAIIALYTLGDMATSYYAPSGSASAASVALLIFSIVCIIKELKAEDDEYFNNGWRNTNYGNTNNKGYNNYGYGNYNYGNYSTQSYQGYKQNETVEFFEPDKKGNKEEKEDRPLVLHYPSQKEARDKISELSKSKLWVMKRSLCSIIGHDITKKYYEPRYVKDEVAVKGNKEDHSRFMPNTNNQWYRERENSEYNLVAKSLGRSCDIAFDGEKFIEDISNEES